MLTFFQKIIIFDSQLQDIGVDGNRLAFRIVGSNGIGSNGVGRRPGFIGAFCRFGAILRRDRRDVGSAAVIWGTGGLGHFLNGGDAAAGG